MDKTGSASTSQDLLAALKVTASQAIPTICRVLQCAPEDIEVTAPLKNGYTNQSYIFQVAGQPYVYRHPGEASAEIIDRRSEYASQTIAANLGIDDTFVAGDPEAGWKISRFIPNTAPFNYHDWNHVAQAMAIARTLHGCGVDSGFDFDIHQDTLKQIALLDEAHRNYFDDLPELLETAELLNADIAGDPSTRCLCHNDFYDENFLVGPERIDLIDWEFSGMSDYASDLGVFIACCPDYTYEDSLRIFELYFQRPLSDEELYHCVAAAAVVSFHWLIWAIFKEYTHEPVGALLDYYNRYTRMFNEKALAMRKEAI